MCGSADKQGAIQCQMQRIGLNADLLFMQTSELTQHSDWGRLSRSADCCQKAGVVHCRPYKKGHFHAVKYVMNHNHDVIMW